MSYKAIAIHQGDALELRHYGRRGMRWGVRKYQNIDGSLTPAGVARYLRKDSGDSYGSRERSTSNNQRGRISGYDDGEYREFNRRETLRSNMPRQVDRGDYTGYGDGTVQKRVRTEYRDVDATGYQNGGGGKSFNDREVRRGNLEDYARRPVERGDYTGYGDGAAQKKVRTEYRNVDATGYQNGGSNRSFNEREALRSNMPRPVDKGDYTGYGDGSAKKNVRTEYREVDATGYQNGSAGRSLNEKEVERQNYNRYDSSNRSFREANTPKRTLEDMGYNDGGSSREEEERRKRRKKEEQQRGHSMSYLGYD